MNLTVFDVFGREIRTLLNEERESGNHELRFDSMNLRNGTYFVRLEAGRNIAERMIVVLK